MKYIYLILSTFLLIGCCAGDCNNTFYQPIETNHIYKDGNGSLILEVNQNPDIFNNKTIDIIVYKMLNNKWLEINRKTKKISTSNGIDINDTAYITYQNQKVFLKENNITVFEDTLPSYQDIVNNLKITTINGYNIKIMPYLTKQFNWDRKKYIVSIYTDERKIDLSKKYKIYYGYIFKDNNSSWNYQLIDDKYQNDYKYRDDNIKIPHYSLDGKANLCINYNLDRCFVLENNKIYLKNLLGEIYNIKYKINSISYPKNYTFDENGNVYMFYNKNVFTESDKYFWFSYFTKDNPTEAKYEQKIDLIKSSQP